MHGSRGFALIRVPHASSYLWHLRGTPRAQKTKRDPRSLGCCHCLGYSAAGCSPLTGHLSAVSSAPGGAPTAQAGVCACTPLPRRGGALQPLKWEERPCLLGWLTPCPQWEGGVITDSPSVWCWELQGSSAGGAGPHKALKGPLPTMGMML